MVLFVALALALTAQQNAPAPPIPPKPIGTFDDPNAGSNHPLQSVGIRGTIDSGGYAASAQVKSQTEFYRQLADLQVAALRSAWAPQDPCSSANSTRTRALGLLLRGQFPAAAVAFEALLRTAAQPETRQLLGLAYEGSGQLEAAAEQFRLAAAEPSDTPSAIAQGAALLFLGEVDQATTAFEHASHRSGDLAPLARLGLGAALFQHGYISQALDSFLDAVDKQPSDLGFRFISVALRAAAPITLTHSVDLLTALTRRLPQSGGAHYALACGLMLAAGGTPDPNQSDAIEAQLKAAVKLDPGLSDAHFRLAEIYAAREDLPPAIAEYRAALDRNPELVEAHYRLSQIYARRGQPELAKQQLELHRTLRARQKGEIESGVVPLRFPVPSGLYPFNDCHGR